MTRGMGKMCQALIADAFPWPTCQADYDLVMSNSDFFDWAWGVTILPHVAVCKNLKHIYFCRKIL